MTATPDELLGIRLYTSEEAAELVRGGADPEQNKIVAATFDNLAMSGEVEFTDFGRKRRWTLQQIRSAIAHCATTGGEEAKASTPDKRETQPAPVEHRRGDVAPFAAKRGSRYAAATR